MIEGNENKAVNVSSGFQQTRETQEVTRLDFSKNLTNFVDTGRSLETIAMVMNESQTTVNLPLSSVYAPYRVADRVIPESSLESFKRFLDGDNAERFEEASSDSMLITLQNDQKDMPL